jgi:hypothetical protein
MDIKKLIRKIAGSPFGIDTIRGLNNNGRHILSSGRAAPVLTDERLHIGDQVITVTDDKDRVFILASKK